MNLSDKERMQGLVDGDYCLQVAYDMIDRFKEAELDNKGFNSLEMLMIKSLFDDLFENTVNNSYKIGREEIENDLSQMIDDDLLNLF
ncbi:hypothetical protein Halha_1464 [Halobacteroides halobius DSM 5150]|uniref:Uncharacterized protein n=1 Tax=Halobacteroides halobius (strain ATCC 35273 / DSM 5150 / MD-1) TaxID=748449 RepID=L0KAL7_HALHC|nr:hypothetical protein [Halobacteroides halobius]AGB41409.1 hypothetical protein Halha_1464 [Halobacteroides halobius DSM 5150]